MVKVKDLDKENYFMYSSVMRNASSEYNALYWFLVIFSSIFSADIIINGFSFMSTAMLFVMILGFFYNYVRVSMQFKHIRRLFNIEKGFSILN